MDKYANFKNVYEQAKRFKYVAEKIIQTGKERFTDKIYGEQFATNGIFAIELYLKALLCYEKSTFTRGHELNILYNKLSEKIKEELKKQKEDIEQYFIEYYDDFMLWRYSFEHDCLYINIKDTCMVLNILDELCEKYYKELEVNE